MMGKKLLFKQIFLFVLVFSLYSGYIAGQSCPTGMISYWKLQELSGPTYNDSYGNHDAIAMSSPSQAPGISGKGQLFNTGASTYISVSDHSDFDWSGTASFSIELWVKFSELGANNRVFIGRDDPTTSTHWWIGQDNTGKIEWDIMSSGGTFSSMVTAGSYNNGLWHHIVAVRDGALAKNYLYVDGVAQNVNDAVVGNFASTANISIGCLVYNDVPDYFFTGTIDEVAIYNKALASTDITSHYNNVRLYQIGYCDGDNPVLLSSPAIYATVGQPYEYDVDASGNSTPVYSLVTNPTGMTIDQITGVISWTPTSATQNGNVVVRATNNKGSVEQSFNINISDVPSCRSNLIAYWDFNETGSAPYFDNISGFKLSGSGANHASGKVGTSLSFDGVNDSLNMEDIAEPANIFFDFDNVPSFSIELWMKSNATPSNTMVMVGRNMQPSTNFTQYWIGVNPDGTVEFQLVDFSGVNVANIKGGSVLNGAWHHIVGTYDAVSNDMKLYVDKTVVDETNKNFLNFGGNSDLNVGYLYTPTDKFWYQGQIDELAFYNTALTDANISSNYDVATAGKGACIYNYAPVIETSPVTSVNQGSLYSYKIIASDRNENDITGISAVTKPAWLSLTYNASDTFAVLSGTPNNADVGTHDVTLRVTDGSLNVDQTFQIQVVNINDPPVITSSPVISTNEDALYSYTIVANDVDLGDVLTYSAPVIPAWLSLDAGTHVLSGTPTNDNVGVFDITINVSDGTVSVPQSFQLTVNNVNDAPVITSTAVETVQANKAYMYEITATDVDEGDVLTFTADTKPSWLTFTAGSTSGILSGTPTAADQGSFAIILKVTDAHGGEALQGFTLTVSAPSGIVNIDNSIIDNVYPNPSSGNVYFNYAGTGKIRVEMFDMTGNLVKEAVADNQKLLEINISDLSTGIYLYKAYLNDKLSIGRISRK